MAAPQPCASRAGFSQNISLSASVWVKDDYDLESVDSLDGWFSVVGGEYGSES